MIKKCKHGVILIATVILRMQKSLVGKAMRVVIHQCAYFVLRAVTLCSALVADITCFYTSTALLAPISICLYACALAYGSAVFIASTFLLITLLPVAIPVSWPLFMVPLLCITALGLGARSLLFTLWPLPYLLVGLYAAVQFGLCLAYPAALLLVPQLTIGSFLVILIVIKIMSLTVSVYQRQGNRV
jgi:hypothetical protein